MIVRWPWSFLFAGACVALSQAASSQLLPQLVPQVQTAPTAQLAREIENAAAESLYAAELAFAAGSSVGAVRTVAADLVIPRVLAFVEFGGAGAAGRGMSVLGLGELYGDGAAREYSECSALVAARATASELGDVPIDDWPVGRIHVYASAHTLRELLRGTRLPATTIVSAFAQRPEHLLAIERSAREERSQPLVQPSNVELPPYCAKFVGQPAEPTLSRDFPRGFQPPARLPGESFRATAFRVLAALPPATAVTIDLKLAAPGDLEHLAALVRDYDIRGMRAELVPGRSDRRLIADVQLSSHGELLASLLRRVECQLRVSEGMYAAAGGWRSDWISVSLTAENAARFLSDPNLAQATVAGGQTLAGFERLAGYYEQLTVRVYELPRSVPIPPGCGGVYEHGNFDEAGVVPGTRSGR